jgi:hypothetical protein
MYHGLSEETKAIITFQQYASFRNPHWSKEDILHGIIIAGKKRKEVARWWEEQRNPTPIRSMQPCHSCKGSWEPNHRCRGKDQECIIEACHDTNDDFCEDGAMDVDLEQSDDDSDTCTEASDSDSFTEVDDSDTLEEDSDSCTLVDTGDYGTLEGDDDPCIVDRQSSGQDNRTSTSENISHGVDDLTPQ